MRLYLRLTVGFFILLIPLLQSADSTQSSLPVTPNEFLNFIKARAAELRANDKPPATLAEWHRRRAHLRRHLQQAWGPFPRQPCPLEARQLGQLQRDGYRVEKIVFQTRPGIWMTANAYVPDRPGKLPAVLNVHGHWRGAKQDPVVQARCIGLAKHGFFVLAVDAFGAGERALGKALGEYHGEMVGATLLPVGLPLAGLQVYENMRAVDYLRTRPEVDAGRIGITGASGGGNQTMYAGAWDERFGAAVPVCSVGNYQAYLGIACCMCEVVPGALTFTEEGGVLALTAPRGLMVVNATRDGIQFSVPEAKKSIAGALPIFQLFDRPDHLKHAIFESGHDYNREMREAMYGWFTRHLQGTGDGSPLPDPAIKTEDPETLRCFPGATRPEDFITIPMFAAATARALLAHRRTAVDGKSWDRQARTMREALANKVLGGFPRLSPNGLNRIIGFASLLFVFQPEPGLTLAAAGDRLLEPPSNGSRRVALLLDLEGEEKVANSDLANALRSSGWSVVTMDLRATGRHAHTGDRIGRAPDHNTAEWALWIGRPLLGQWTCDVRRLLDLLTGALTPNPSPRGRGELRDIAVIGVGPAGVVALCAAALDVRITHVATVGTLASYVTEVPYMNQRLGIMAPGMLRDVGDIAELVALVAPRRVVIAGGVSGGGTALSRGELYENYARSRRVFAAKKAERELIIEGSMTAEKVVASLR